MCGEKMYVKRDEIEAEGSPPRVRGKARFPGRTAVAWGITPACAGKSRQDRFVWICAQDHPRVCGEKQANTPESRF